MAGVKINTAKNPKHKNGCSNANNYQFSDTSEKYFSATLPLPCTKLFCFLTATSKKLRGGEQAVDGLARRGCMTISAKGF